MLRLGPRLKLPKTCQQNNSSNKTTIAQELFSVTLLGEVREGVKNILRGGLPTF
jgi:hypothetical protein